MPPKTYIADFEGDPAQMSEGDRQVNRNIAAWLFREVMKGKPGPTLDVGGKLPVLADALAGLGCFAMAMDAEPVECFERVRTITGDFEQDELDKPGDGYRLITLIHVFEHLYDPLAAIHKLRRLIADDGAVFIRLPDHRVPGFERDLTVGHYTIHPFFHTALSIAELCLRTGTFEIESANEVRPGQRDMILRPIKPKQAPAIVKGLRRAIALHRPGAIGDILMTLNLLPAFKAANPDTEVHYFCSEALARPNALGSIIRQAGADAVLDCAQLPNQTWRYERVIPLIGYPLLEGYPEKPMRRHLLEYFASEMGLPDLSGDFTIEGWDYGKHVEFALPALTLPRPERPYRAQNWEKDYITVQMRAGWSKYKQWDEGRWRQVLDALKPIEIRIIDAGVGSGAPLSYAIGLVANARMHIGIDSFCNHLTNYYWQDEHGNGRRVPGVILWGSTQASAAGYSHNTNISLGLPWLPCQPCFREDPKISRMPRGPCVNVVERAAADWHENSEGFYEDHWEPATSYDDPRPHACMDEISVEQVVEAVRDMWGRVQ